MLEASQITPILAYLFFLGGGDSLELPPLKETAAYMSFGV